MKAITTMAALALALLFGGANATTFTLGTDGGNGYLIGGYPSFSLVGADFPDAEVATLTTYSGIIDADSSLSFAYVYTTNDVDGSDYDPAGYILNGVQYQLSPFNQPQGSSWGGIATVILHVGDSFGWYVSSFDSVLGAGVLTVGPVPEAETYALLLAGLGLMGVVARRQQRRY